VGKEWRSCGKRQIMQMMPPVKEYLTVCYMEVDYESPDVHQLRR
jgi:hypothetical protein